jgi:hypothetical protein
MSLSEDEMYRQKYLKYKNKYLQLEEEINGGGSPFGIRNLIKKTAAAAAPKIKAAGKEVAKSAAATGKEVAKSAAAEVAAAAEFAAAEVALNIAPQVGNLAATGAAAAQQATQTALAKGSAAAQQAAQTALAKGSAAAQQLAQNAVSAIGNIGDIIKKLDVNTLSNYLTEEQKQKLVSLLLPQLKQNNF